MMYFWQKQRMEGRLRVAVDRGALDHGSLISRHDAAMGRVTTHHFSYTYLPSYGYFYYLERAAALRIPGRERNGNKTLF